MCSGTCAMLHWVFSLLGSHGGRLGGRWWGLLLLLQRELLMLMLLRRMLLLLLFLCTATPRSTGTATC